MAKLKMNPDPLHVGTMVLTTSKEKAAWARLVEKSRLSDKDRLLHGDPTAEPPRGVIVHPTD